MKVEGYFSNIKEANETVEKLNNQGFKGAFVDINDHRSSAYSQSGTLGAEGMSSLSGAVLGKSNITGERSSSPLVAASPMVSGMGNFEEVANVECKVVVDINDTDLQNVNNIISSMGGSTKNPNVQIPKGLENIDQDAFIFKNLRK
ncbi:hypothetical protein [Clostridium cellulovorans]|uniref:Uncharacterized protein n=1 Tax=Clostridium cellulovorans (strain ATCC 35296 / DSM 3052 / OCM 3 / 743B) TaxID=573061 RepID=D9SKT1_CLOC7|nr:hypothetical protein [Clostridium cellulovorans]ADL53503.1 hypothetical protein Clocel_3833 [Clostridium cellulovorans 743B]